ncbi:MAG: c-type cytochrome domain-containing protein [Roseimicrobium sp.]
MAVSAAVEFEKEVLPVLEAKCLKCHRAPHMEEGKEVKPKSELRLDAPWAMLKGGESKRAALVPKDSAKSYMFEVVNLPKDDDMFMPPKGDPLTKDEIAKLKTWIDEGANFGAWQANSEGKPADAPAASGALPPPKDREHDKIYKALSVGLEPPNAEATKKVQAVGAQVSILQVGGPLVRVDFLTGVSKCTDESLAALTPVQQNIAHLDLARTAITDAALKTAATFPRLTRLDLRKTKITDTGLQALAACKNLNYINLFGTEVSDAGLTALGKVKTLRNVYLFETKVTEAGVAKLRAALPKADIVSQVVMPTPSAAAHGGGKGKKNK